MEILFEIIIRSIIINFLGVNTRYYFFKMLGKNYKKDDFIKHKDDIIYAFSQEFYNFIVGITVSIFLFMAIFYILNIFR